jgi:hypothetical protein
MKAVSQKACHQQPEVFPSGREGVTRNFQGRTALERLEALSSKQPGLLGHIDHKNTY